jgi:protein SCO1/2
MRPEELLRVFVVALAVALAPPALAGGGCDRCAPRAANGAVGEGSAAASDVTLADVPLVDQDGRAVRFPAVAGDGIVVMNFVYTTCTTVCPVLSSILRGVQARLGEALGADVRLVSLSIDPVRDTPARLRAYAARHGAGPHWTWLTGTAADVEKALRGAGAYSADFASHAPMILVGDARSGRWYRLNGFPTQDRIVARVDELRALRATATAARSAR